MLLFPSQAGVNGDVLVGTPRILREDRVVEGRGLEVQVSELSTYLKQINSHAPVAAIRVREAGNSQFGHAAEPTAGAELECRIHAVGYESLLQGWNVCGHCSGCGVDRDLRAGSCLVPIIV